MPQKRDFSRYELDLKTSNTLDEMGLGKTIQAISYVLSLRHAMQNNCDYLPFLVVAPLSTLENWKKEFFLWAPDLNVICYTGDVESRAIIRNFEFYLDKGSDVLSSNDNYDSDLDPSSSSNSSESPEPLKDKIAKFDVLLTSYNFSMSDAKFLRAFEWESLIIDEGHRLKNEKAKAFQQLSKYRVRHRVIITGTPMQNNIKELFTLLHFIDNKHNISELERKFESLENQEQVRELHKLLKPHILRRMKSDVLKELPKKVEIIVPISMTDLQQQCYREILTGNFKTLVQGNKGSPSKLNNVLSGLYSLCSPPNASGLQKCVDHPYLLDGVEPKTASPEEEQRLLIEASGKLSLLDKMLPKLKERSNRVLIFSHMTMMLTILEDYLGVKVHRLVFDLLFKGYTYARLDGKTDAEVRHRDIQRFNSSDDYFIYLISTRAGGLGINLATADTVILYDAGFNPHDEKQVFRTEYSALPVRLSHVLTESAKRTK